MRLALGIQAPTPVMSARIAKVTMILVRIEDLDDRDFLVIVEPSSLLSVKCAIKDCILKTLNVAGVIGTGYFQR